MAKLFTLRNVTSSLILSMFDFESDRQREDLSVPFCYFIRVASSVICIYDAFICIFSRHITNLVIGCPWTCRSLCVDHAAETVLKREKCTAIH